MDTPTSRSILSLRSDKQALVATTTTAEVLEIILVRLTVVVKPPQLNDDYDRHQTLAGRDRGDQDLHFEYRTSF